MIGHVLLTPTASKIARPAIFLDRDGTLTEYRGYITEPGQLRLLQGAAKAISKWKTAGFLCVLITNQSAIGRGMITEEILNDIHHRLMELLAAEDASLDANYYCPEAPDGGDEFTVSSPDRKPGAGMLLRAADDLNLDLSRSWMIGDRFSDVLAGVNAGCRGSLRVRSGYHYSDGELELSCHYHTMETVGDAAQFILNGGASCSECSLT